MPEQVMNEEDGMVGVEDILNGTPTRVYLEAIGDGRVEHGRVRGPVDFVLPKSKASGHEPAIHLVLPVRNAPFAWTLVQLRIPL